MSSEEAVLATLMSQATISRLSPNPHSKVFRQGSLAVCPGNTASGGKVQSHLTDYRNFLKARMTPGNGDEKPKYYAERLSICMYCTTVLAKPQPPQQMMNRSARPGTQGVQTPRPQVFHQVPAQVVYQQVPPQIQQQAPQQVPQQQVVYVQRPRRSASRTRFQ